MRDQTWNLFIDDERWPSDVNWASWYGIRDEWTVARTWGETRTLIDTYGVPSFISFDHDLGDEQVCLNGYEIAQQLVEKDMNGEWQIPPDFDFEAHSQNVCGDENIRSLLNNYLRFKRSQ